MTFFDGHARRWMRHLAGNWLPRAATAAPAPTPGAGDIVLKPFIDSETYKQMFRVETWSTHDVLDGPFDDVRRALECAFELGVTSRLSVWVDYSDDPEEHALDAVPLYSAEPAAAHTESFA